MQLHRFDHPKTFWQQAQDYLLQYPAEHNLLLGISQTLLHDPHYYSARPYLAIVDDQSTILAAAIRTPPYKLVLAKAQALDAVALIAQDVQADGNLPGVSGLVAETQTFVQTWQTLTGSTYQQTMELRIHQLTHVKPVASASGYLRPAVESDRSLLVQWFADFAAEIGEVVMDDPEQMTDHGLRRQRIYLWDDGVPVSVACGSQSVGFGRIGPVYTPLEFRRRGYATACVAALSQQLLNQGCQSCFLFTDLANPTSNHIYRAIGYRSICNWQDYSFVVEASR